MTVPRSAVTIWTVHPIPLRARHRRIMQIV
jgi:hypothetical protein